MDFAGPFDSIYTYDSIMGLSTSTTFIASIILGASLVQAALNLDGTQAVGQPTGQRRAVR